MLSILMVALAKGKFNEYGILKYISAIIVCVGITIFNLIDN